MSTISKINGIAIGSISKINGIAKANISKVDGISISVWMSPTAIHSKCGESAGHPASNTIDGSLSSAWYHTIGHEHWIIFDLGATKTVQKVKLYCTTSESTALRICEVSAVYINDTHDESGGSKGSLVLSGTGVEWHEIDVTDTNGRYIKLKLKTRSADYDCETTHGMEEFYEFEAYGSICAGAWVSPTAIPSRCGEEFAYPASKLIDGDLGTEWQHMVGHEHWVIFDLGSTKTVQKVRLYCVGSGRYGPCEVTAVYINDTADETGGSKGSGVLSGILQWIEIDVTDTSGRYIKIKLKTNDINGVNCSTSNELLFFYEFEAYV